MYITKNRTSEVLLLCITILLLHVASAFHDFVLIPYVTHRLSDPYAAFVEPVWKLLFWITPAFLYMKYVNQSDPLMYLKLNKNIGKGIIWGLTVSLIFVPGILYNHLFQGIPFHLDFGLGGWLNTVLLVGLVEEIPFRGFVFQELDELLGFWKASIISSLLFVTLHIPYWISLGKPLFPYITNNSIYIFIFAFALCFILKRSGSLWSCIIIHSVNDFVSML